MIGSLRALVAPTAPKARRLGVLAAAIFAQCIGLIWLLSISSRPAQAITRPQQTTSVVIQPANTTVAAGQTRLFTATLSPPMGSVVWTVITGRGSIVSTGPVTALVQVTTTVGMYPNAVIATASNGVFGTASFTVTPGPLANIAVSPSLANMTVGEVQSFSASGSDAYDNVIPNLTVAWSAAPGAGAIASSGPLTAAFAAGTTPGTYPNGVRATSQGVTGTANVFLVAGPPAQVVVAPAAVTLGIGATQAFTASVFDAYGNLLNLGVTWLTPSNAGNIESSGPVTAVFKAGTKAGGFSDGLVATNGQASGNAVITVPVDPTGDLQISANPGTITTDGVSASIITVQVTDQYGNAVSTGVPVTLAIDHCAGVCVLGTNAANTDAAGRVATTLRSENRSATSTVTSLIKVSASVNGVNGLVSKQITVNGTFTPFRSHLPVSNRDTSLNNHTSCAALLITPPQSVSQAPNNAFNIYRFTAAKASYTISLQNYRVAGTLAVYRILQDNCATNGSISVATVSLPTPIGVSGAFQMTLPNAFAPGSAYLLVVNTTGAGSSTHYTITVQ